jgi:hypothetical protein
MSPSVNSDLADLHNLQSSKFNPSERCYYKYGPNVGQPSYKGWHQTIIRRYLQITRRDGPSFRGTVTQKLISK